MDQNAELNSNAFAQTVIAINANEPVKFNRIYICPDSATICDGSHYVKYFMQTASYASTASKSWDGKNSSGAVVPDGIYKIAVDISDFLGNEISIALTPYIINVKTVPLAPPSNDATIASAIYTVSPLADRTGTITGVAYVTVKSAFESALVKGESHQTWNDLRISDPVATGDILSVTAQDGTTTATYTIIADQTNWAQGTIDSFTPNGNFVCHTGDFMPNEQTKCSIGVENFRDVYPNRDNQLSAGGGSSCAGYYPTFNLNMSNYKVPGEYDFYLSYCGYTGDRCLGKYPVGDYYRVYFDGTSWSPVSIDSTKTRQSNDASITSNNYYVVSELSPTYTSGAFTSGAGTISNIPINTSRTVFESAIMPAAGATLDFSGITDPVLSGNTLVVTAQNKITKSTYAVGVDTISWSQGIINSFAPAGQFYLNTSFMTNNPHLICGIGNYQSLYPSVANQLSGGAFSCGGVNTNPVYFVDMKNFLTVGDYSIRIYDPSTGLGKYYNMHFNGTNWSASNPVLNNDATITSATYTVSALANSAGTIINIPYGTSRPAFENALIKNESHQTWDDSKISDPVATGNILISTAQDGTTKATYTITVLPAPAIQLKITSAPQTILAGTASGVFTVQSQNYAGASTKVSTSTAVGLSSSSPTGLFSGATIGGSCDSDFSKTSVTISKGDANKGFCYQDSSAGTFAITVSAVGLSSDSQNITVNPANPP